MTSEKLLTFIKKYRILLIILLIAFLCCSFVSTLLFLISNAGVADDYSHIPNENPLLNNILSYTNPPLDLNEAPNLSRTELEQKLSESISSKFKVEDKGNCLSTITSQTFKTINLDFNSCIWDFSINYSTQISLSASARYIHNFLTFTNKVTNEQVEVEFFYPGVYEYFGPIATCYSNDNSISKINDSIYRYEIQIEDNGEIKDINTYLASELIVRRGDTDFDEIINTVYTDMYAVSYANNISKENAEVCIKAGPNFALSADYSVEELEIFKQFYSHDVSFSPRDILVLIWTSKTISNSTIDELISGFTL